MTAQFVRVRLLLVVGVAQKIPVVLGRTIPRVRLTHVDGAGRGGYSVAFRHHPVASRKQVRSRGHGES